MRKIFFATMLAIASPAVAHEHHCAHHWQHVSGYGYPHPDSYREQMRNAYCFNYMRTHWRETPNLPKACP